MKFHRVIAFLVPLVLVFAHATTSAPIPYPKPIEDIYPTQLPDFNNNQTPVSGDYGAFQSLLASGFAVDINDNSAMTGKKSKKN
ncbi:uncharacterized protein MEPE_05982 [Melanopsichium pennsylvanicum]|uniref:Uncharacterized protein n=2 Tax=Melanopsichium pennsylvanicum TaxID=63383 RepID=A0AAJ5C7T4_9BASI|nr:putative protein [Melanopsichium pennsylvanicum 4]SNX87272.1 uncharacterized protein MEPE_05982 [Melanopsichium pennsylvanicum]